MDEEIKGADTHEGHPECVCTDGRESERDVCDPCDS